jgi:hypothetical protein
MTLREKLVWGPVDVFGRTIETSVTPDESSVLITCAKDRDVLEVGAGYGYSAIIMAQSARSVTSVDPHAGELYRSLDVMTAHLQALRLQHKVMIIRDYSERALPTMAGKARKFGFVFIDGNHNTAVRGDVMTGMTLLEPGAWIAVHDYGQYDFPSITHVCDEVCSPPQRLVDTLWMWQAPE